MKCTFLLLFSLFANLYASVGPNVKKYDRLEFSSICKLSISDSTGRIGTCTGTVISSNQILTAEHCFGVKNLDKIVIVATCGNSEIDEFKSLKTYRKNSKDDAGYDLAILETKSLIKEINPIPITKYPQIYFERPMCRVMGFGSDEQKRTDDLRGFDLNSERLFYSKDFQKYIRMSSKLGPVLLNTVTEGDSGGPLLCRMTEKSPWEILGVSSTYHRDRPTKSIIDNYFMPAFILNSNL